LNNQDSHAYLIEAPMADSAKSTAATVARVLIVDDHPAVRRGLCDIVSREPDLQICGEAGNLSEAREKMREQSPDVIIIDIFLKNEDGLELIREARQTTPTAKTLVCSMHPPSSYAKEAIGAGASGYISKAEAVEQLTAAIRAVMSGDTYVGND